MARVRTSALVAAASLSAIAGISRADETLSYTYDARGRLISVVHNGTVNANLVTNYTFDAADNRKSMNVTGANSS